MMNYGDAMKIVRLPELIEIVGMSPDTIRRLESNGTFPLRLKIGQSAVGWLDSDITSWIESKKKKETSKKIKLRKT